jgi:hypothetical protein
MMGEHNSDQAMALRARLEQAEREREAWRGKDSEHYQMACALVDSLKKQLEELAGERRPAN